MKIGLCGTMSVGKTTLVNAYLSDLGIPLNTDSTLKGQTVFLAERCAELMHKDIITDRTIIDVMAFTMNAKSIDYKDKEAFEQYAIEFLREYDYVFYISPEGIPIEDNGVRETDEYYRDVIDFSITTLIKRYSHRMDNIEVIKGTTEERIEQILKFVGL
jgi:hypothetical protein